MHPAESKRIVYQSWEAYEYRFPIIDLPTEADEEWRTWLEPLVGLDANSVHEFVRQRFEKVGTQFTDLRDRVLEYSPFSILVYCGTPLLWLHRPHISEHDFIYLPPEADRAEVLKQLEPYALDSPEPVADLLANFGGMGERWPWEEIAFEGEKANGRIVITDANVSFTAGWEYCSEAERQKRLDNVRRWLGGITILTGGDDMAWHLGKDGSVCEHTCGDAHVESVCDSLPDLIVAFLPSDPTTTLFDRAYSGLRSIEDNDGPTLNIHQSN